MSLVTGHAPAPRMVSTSNQNVDMRGVSHLAHGGCAVASGHGHVAAGEEQGGGGGPGAGPRVGQVPLQARDGARTQGGGVAVN